MLAAALIAAATALPALATPTVGHPTGAPASGNDVDAPIPAGPVITFSGRQWLVEPNPTGSGPGSNLYPGLPTNAWVDLQGYLHLQLFKVDNSWLAADVTSVDNFGHGTYRWVLDGPTNFTEPDVALGMFTYDATNSAYGHREMDIELAHWGWTQTRWDSQFVVQPYYVADHMDRFLEPTTGPTTQEFTWGAARTTFDVRAGDQPNSPLAYAWKGPVLPTPADSTTKVSMNLWMYDNTAKTSATSFEVVIRSFTYTPAP